MSWKNANCTVFRETLEKGSGKWTEYRWQRRCCWLLQALQIHIFFFLEAKTLHSLHNGWMMFLDMWVSGKQIGRWWDILFAFKDHIIFFYYEPLKSKYAAIWQQQSQPLNTLCLAIDICLKNLWIFFYTLAKCKQVICHILIIVSVLFFSSNFTKRFWQTFVSFSEIQRSMPLKCLSEKAWSKHLKLQTWLEFFQQNTNTVVLFSFVVFVRKSEGKLLTMSFVMAAESEECETTHAHNQVGTITHNDILFFPYLDLPRLFWSVSHSWYFSHVKVLVTEVECGALKRKWASDTFRIIVILSKYTAGFKL